EQGHPLAIGRERVLSRYELRVERAQLQIGNRDRRDQTQHDASPRLFGSNQACLRRFGLAPDAPPEIDLPAGAENALEEILRISRAGRQCDSLPLGKSVALRGEGIVELRVKSRPRAHQDTGRL